MIFQSFPGVHAGAGVYGAGVHACPGEHELGGGTETQQGAHIQHQYCTVLYCTALYCTVLYCTLLYFTLLYFTELN